jgi:hypothetical protein
MIEYPFLWLKIAVRDMNFGLESIAQENPEVVHFWQSFISLHNS